MYYEARLQNIPTNHTVPYIKQFSSLYDFIAWRNDCVVNRNQKVHWVKDEWGKVHFGLIKKDGSLSNQGPTFDSGAHQSDAYKEAKKKYDNPETAILA